MSEFVRDSYRDPDRGILFVFRPNEAWATCKDEWDRICPEIKRWLKDQGCAKSMAVGQCVFIPAGREDLAVAFKLRWC